MRAIARDTHSWSLGWMWFNLRFIKEQLSLLKHRGIIVNGYSSRNGTLSMYGVISTI